MLTVKINVANYILETKAMQPHSKSLRYLEGQMNLI